ncbi:MAG: GNAT family N-acetyltransferase, partial [Candidatus Eisenbacteria bacterium]|nr:GNAT family N-acetyltransferase [Candidatus Eisenbacteria bacterium]
MTIRVDFCQAPEDFAHTYRPISHYFGGTIRESDLANMTQIFDYRRSLRAWDGDLVVGGAGSHSHRLTVPGGEAEAAAVTIVGVLPTHRRRGVLRSLMREQLDRIHEAGEPLAYLWASEETIYGRFGYGMASLAASIELPKSDGVLDDLPLRGEIRYLTEEEAYEPISQLHERIRPQYPGMFSRPESWWKLRTLIDLEHRRGGGGVLNRVVLSLDGRPEAYALYRMHQSLRAGISHGYVNVIEALGATPEATREIWRFLASIDWVANLKASLLPLDHPLFFQMVRPRHARPTLIDGLWMRVVDVEKALAARSITAACPVVLAIHDPFCPWNEGRYRVGEGKVERSTADPDLS